MGRKVSRGKAPEGRALLFWLCAAGVVAFHCALARRWVQVDRQPPNWDPSVHLGTALDYKEAWRDGRWLDLLLTRARAGHPQYPPVYHYSLIPLLSMENPQTAAVWLNLAYLFITLFSAAAMERQLRPDSSWPAATVLLALALSPRVVHIFRDVFVDLSLTAWTALAYALILRSDFFRRRGLSLAVGVFTALAVLSKWGGVLYLLPGACAGLTDAQRRRNLKAALGVAALLCAPWYLINTPQMIPRIWASVILGPRQGNPLPLTWWNWLYYGGFLNAAFSWPLVILMIAGAALALRDGRDRTAKLVLAGWFGFSYLFCALVPSKDHRYFLPALAALPVLGLSGLPGPALAAGAALALWHGRNLRQPDPGEWHLADILQTVEKAKTGPGISNLCMLANHKDLNATTMTWLARHLGLTDISLDCQQTDIPEWADFVLVKTGDDPGAFLSDNTLGILARIKAQEGLFPKVYKPAKRWPLPDGSEAVLYEQRGDIPPLAGARRIPELTVKNARLHDVAIAAQGPGRYSLTVGSLVLDKLEAPIRDIKLELSGARLLDAGGRIRVLRLQAIRLLSARASWADLAAALKKRSGLDIGLAEQDSTLRVSAGPLNLRLSARLEDRDFRLDVTEARLAGLRLPLAGGWHWSRNLSAHPPYQPYDLDARPIHFTKEGFSIGG